MTINTIALPSTPDDLPDEVFPPLQRIARSERVGPAVANRQIRGLDKRTRTITDKVNEVISELSLGGGLLRANGSVAITGDIDFGGFEATNAAPSSGPNSLITRAELDDAVGSGGSGLRNYVLNPGAEVSTIGWSVYDDGASALPVNGTGGSPGITITRSTSAPLSGSGSFLLNKVGAVDRQGEGWAYAFTLDPADQNKRLTVTFDIRKVSGTYAANTLKVFIYDVTNARLCSSGENSVSGEGLATVTFSTSDSLSYRLLIHVTTADTNNWVFKVDNVFVGVLPFSHSVAASDWTDAGAMTITGATSDPTKGTRVLDKVWYARTGDRARVRFEYDQTTSGAAGSGSYFIHLPQGLALDTTKVTTFSGTLTPTSAQAYCIAEAQLSHGGSMYYGLVVPYDATRLVMYLMINTGASSDNWDSGFNGSGYGGASVKYSFEFEAPIAGWSGSMAVMPGHRYRWAQKFGSSAVRVTTTPSKPGEYRATRAGADTAPGTLVTSASGLFITSDTDGSMPDGEIDVYQVYVGKGKVVAIDGVWESPNRVNALSWDFHSGSGSSLDLHGIRWVYHSATGVVYIRARGVSVGLDLADLAHKSAGYFDILVADDPVPVAQAPTVHLEATSSVSQATTAAVTNLQFEDVVYDSHGAWAADTFTAPVDGVYQCSACATYVTDSSEYTYLALYLNGTPYRAGSPSYHGFSGGTFPVHFAGNVRLRAGDQVAFRNMADTDTRTSDPTHNWVAITRIGDV